jgi:hypothetical protein
MLMKPVTKSRNQREGGYLGRYKSVYDAMWYIEDAPVPHRRHHRKGNWHWKTLRELKDKA